jgi:hypothetical protein
MVFIKETGNELMVLCPGGGKKERPVVIYQNQVFDFVRTTVMNHRNHPDTRVGVWFVFIITAQHR